MPKKLNIAPLFIVIGIAAVLQFALIGIDCRETPLKVAKNFAGAYYYLDADMQDYLCADLAKDGELVGNFLILKEKEASQRGLRNNYLRHKFLNMHASIIASDQDTMKVHLTGTTRVCINPAFMLVGKLFHIGNDYAVDETLDLVKEKEGWRVCGAPLGLNPEI